MALTDRILNALGVVPKKQHYQATKRAYESGYSDRYSADRGNDEPPSGDIARFGYRTATQGGLRAFDIDPLRAQNVAWDIWQSNPLARRALQIKRDYILGRGVKFQATDERAQPVVDEFVASSRLNRRLTMFVLELFLFGEQCYPAFVRGSDGRVLLGYIDPAQILEVVMHPENALESWAVVIRPQTSARPWEASYAQRVYRIIRPADSGQYHDRLVTAEQAELEEWEVHMLASFGLEKYTGSCFWQRVNGVSNGGRGYSDLLQVADWLDAHDATLFAVGDREQQANYFAWDVTLDGADPDQVAQRATELVKNPPRKGEVRVHNNAEKWEYVFPDIKTMASADAAGALMTFCLGGLGIPRHWYGFGDETNRATAQAQGDPTWRTLQHDQDGEKDQLETMARFAVDQAIIAGKLPPDVCHDVEVVMPEMTSRDVSALAGALSSIESALTQAEQAQHIGNGQAREVFAKVVAELGVELDPDKTNKEIEAAGLDQAQQGNDQAQPYMQALQQPGVSSAQPPFPQREADTWDEKKHPRKGGQFAKKGQGDSGAKKDEPKADKKALGIEQHGPPRDAAGRIVLGQSKVSDPTSGHLDMSYQITTKTAHLPNGVDVPMPAAANVSAKKDGDHLTVVSIYVADELRRGGVAQQMVQNLVDEGRKQGYSYVTTSGVLSTDGRALFDGLAAKGLAQKQGDNYIIPITAKKD